MNTMQQLLYSIYIASVVVNLIIAIELGKISWSWWLIPFVLLGPISYPFILLYLILTK